jgi:spermidine dehydrogenase
LNVEAIAMTSRITRRDFLNGTALTIAAGLLPIDQLRAATPVAYPPALSGMRGSHDGAFEVAHQLAREGRTFPLDGLKVEETYDLVIVGAGISGLSAAWFHRQNNPKARILVLDNHDDFGGHAKRIEFQVEGRLLIGYGGSESMVSPRKKLGSDAKRMFKALRLDMEAFYKEQVFHRTLYPKLGLSRATFFDKETFGVDKLVAGDPVKINYDEFGANNPNARTPAAFLKDCPLGAETKAALARLMADRTDYLAGRKLAQKKKLLTKISYRAFLEQHVKLAKDGCDFYQGRLNDSYGLGIDTISALDTFGAGYPGWRGMGLKQADLGAEGEVAEPYIHHFPDGNATITRMLVRALIPGVALGRSMGDVITAKFDYTKLDRPETAVRLRLNSTVVSLRNEGNGVVIGYVRDGKLARIDAGLAIVAGFASMMPNMIPEMPAAQKAFLARNVKTAMLYNKVAIRNWTAFQKLGVHTINAPTSYHSMVKLDYPVSLGAYKFPRDPMQPMCLQMVHVPLTPNQALNGVEQMRAGRSKLFTTPFADIEQQIRADLDRMLGAGGFDSKRDIAGITVNRWSHGYAYTPSSLIDDVKAMEKGAEMARKPIGRIVLASADTAWNAYAHSAIDEAARAVKEIARK